MTKAAIERVLVAVGICCLVSCQPPAASDHASPSPSGSIYVRAEGSVSNVRPRNLSEDEARGGHILRKHVGQTEEQLRERLERERSITGASTYTDRSTAEHAVGAAIAQSQSEIQSWLSRPGRHPNLVLDYDSDAPIGRTMNRGEVHSHVCEHEVVVLKYDGPNEYYILTSYPECR